MQNGVVDMFSTSEEGGRTLRTPRFMRSNDFGDQQNEGHRYFEGIAHGSS